jgi:hypothetical protein
VWCDYTAELHLPPTAESEGALVGSVVWLETQNAAPTTRPRQ